MTLEERIARVQDHYPDPMTQQEFADAVGIGISSAYRLNRKGTVPFEEVREGFCHHYSIRKSDVLSYLQARYAHESVGFREESLCYIREYLESEPEILTVKDVMRIAGVCKSAVNKWITYGKLPGFYYMHGLRVRKDDLIIFMSSPVFLDSSHRNGQAEIIAQNVMERIQRSMRGTAHAGEAQ